MGSAGEMLRRLAPPRTQKLGQASDRVAVFLIAAVKSSHDAGMGACWRMSSRLRMYMLSTVQIAMRGPALMLGHREEFRHAAVVDAADVPLQRSL